MSNNEEQESNYGEECANELIVTKISKFLEVNKIGISDFWQSDRNYASPQDL